jgi:hypothetical protein
MNEKAGLGCLLLLLGIAVIIGLWVYIVMTYGWSLLFIVIAAKFLSGVLIGGAKLLFED